MPSQHKLQILCAADIFLFVILALAGIVLTAWIWLPESRQAGRLEIRQDGSILLAIPLDRDTEQTIAATNGGTNTFQIRDGIVTMQAADCGDLTCIRTGTISRTGEAIVCLPHRLVLQIVGSDEPEDETPPDAIVR